MDAFREWYVIYARHKDLLQKRITDIKEQGDRIIVTYKDHVEQVHLVEKLSSFDLKELGDPDGYHHLVLANTLANVSAVVKEWKALVGYPHLKIIFYNPEAKEKWILWPAVHDKVAEPDMLEDGLKGLSEHVPFLDAPEQA